MTTQTFKQQWAGRKFRCKTTGETFTIPDDVRECQFFSFGNCFVDVGRYKCYARFGGDIEEITEDSGDYV